MDHAALKALADPVRCQIIELLSREELCGCHLVDDLGLAQSLVSHHLKVLREAGLVSTSRERYWTYYRLDAGAVARLADAIQDVAVNAARVDGSRRPCC